MKIAIDTQHDSPDDIKKVIELLQQMINRGSYRQSSSSGSNDMFASNEPSSSGSNDMFAPSEPSEPSPASGGLFSMFGSPPSTPSSSLGDDSDSTDEEEEKPEPKPQVIMY